MDKIPELKSKREPIAIIGIGCRFPGAANLESPTGGCAKAIPRYFDTSEYFVAAWPATAPLLVLTIWPTVKLSCCGNAVKPRLKRGIKL